MADLTQFDLGSARRIAGVVRKVEGEPPRAKSLTFDAVQQQHSRRVFRICTFTGAWSKNSAKVVTFKYQTAMPNTASATNLFAEIGTAVSSRNCAIARDGSAWFLVAAEC